MLSILIPIYNVDTVALVNMLLKQVEKTKIRCEIICLNDASTLFLEENKKLLEYPHVRYEVLKTNIGRSKIRNLLAKKAQYDWLLFLDADVLPIDGAFIENYKAFLTKDIKVVNGGIVYSDIKPEKDRLLRWVYGKKREAVACESRRKNPYLSFLTLNFLIHKSIMERVNFNEAIPNLRHEDTLFSYTLKLHQIPIAHINNPVCHIGLDLFDNAMRKESESLFALKNLVDQNLIPSDYLKISKAFELLKKLKLVSVVASVHRLTRTIFIRNLASSKPSLFVFDLYRLGYLCKLDADQ